jgi:uncharacterized cupin superfamily protein
MASQLLTFDLQTITPDENIIAEDRVISGAPRTRTWNMEESPDGKLYAGIWEATPGKWRVSYDEWEYCQLESGVSVVTEDGGKAVTLKAGSSLVLRPGFQGTWEVLETTRKTYVIRLP